MFIHLGNDVMVPSDEIVAIFDQSLLEKRNMAFAGNHEKAHLVIDIGEQDTKSVVVTEDDTIYFSPFSTLTLRRRLESNTSG
ncbi:MAG TPA: extracellular matrix/biofilm biosynthesis regulator RemA family protein [Bacillales bacterium]|nr:extracellular matrix/biofilm biosynthesis regulator RemA family protein [Bacillales bacterium]